MFCCRKRGTLEHHGKKCTAIKLDEITVYRSKDASENQSSSQYNVHFYSHKQDDTCRRPRDVTPIEISSQLYLFGSFRENAPHYNIKESANSHKICIVKIDDTHGSVASDLLLTCQQISQNQAITDLQIIGFHCDKSLAVPNNVFNMSKAAQSIKIANSTLPLNSVEQLMQQLQQCKYLTAIHLEKIRLYNPKKTQQIEVTHFDLGNQGKFLADMIRNFGSDPLLQQLYLPNCLIQEEGCIEMLKYLPSCRHLTHLNLSENRVGKAGIHIVKTIENMGLDPPLKLLYLRDCSIPSNICGDILRSLPRCKFLTSLDLGGHELENQGKLLADMIKHFGSHSLLQHLYLPNCSIQEKDCTEMLKYLALCQLLNYLDLSGNKVGKAGIHIANIIENMRLYPSLQLLYLRDCSIPSNTCGDILKCLSQCKLLTHLDLGGHDLGNQGKLLADMIKNFGSDPLLQQLYLPNCLIQEEGCVEILKYLPSCRHLTHLNLSGNKVGKAGIHIVKTIESMGLDPPLELLYLRNCSIPSDMCGDILKCLSQCKLLTHLDLGGHDLSNCGKFLAELIKSLGSDSPLHQLHLGNCSIPEEECTEILKYLPSCLHLTDLDLSGNKVEKAGINIAKAIENMGLDPPLKLLYLRDCSIPSDICGEILKCLSQCKLLTYFSLDL